VSVVYQPSVSGGVEIPVPDDRTYVIAGENRTYLIESESRVWNIPLESRVYTITQGA
jgi:hypothetical protein